MAAHSRVQQRIINYSISHCPCSWEVLCWPDWRVHTPCGKQGTVSMSLGIDSKETAVIRTKFKSLYSVTCVLYNIDLLEPHIIRATKRIRYHSNANPVLFPITIHSCCQPRFQPRPREACARRPQSPWPYHCLDQGLHYHTGEAVHFEWESSPVPPCLHEWLAGDCLLVFQDQGYPQIKNYTGIDPR